MKNNENCVRYLILNPCKTTIYFHNRKENIYIIINTFKTGLQEIFDCCDISHDRLIVIMQRTSWNYNVESETKEKRERKPHCQTGGSFKSCQNQ